MREFTVVNDRATVYQLGIRNEELGMATSIAKYLRCFRKRKMRGCNNKGARECTEVHDRATVYQLGMRN